MLGVTVRAAHDFVGTRPSASKEAAARAAPVRDRRCRALSRQTEKSTIRARCAEPCAVFRREPKLSSSRRSLSVRSIVTAVLPTANPPAQRSHRRIAHICRSGHLGRCERPRVTNIHPWQQAMRSSKHSQRLLGDSRSAFRNQADTRRDWHSVDPSRRPRRKGQGRIAQKV